MTALPNVTASWPAAAASVPAARRTIRHYLAVHGCEGLTDSAELVLTELVTNVVLHVGGTIDVHAALTADGGLLLEVSDRSAAVPQQRMFSTTSSTGRGMRLVHSLSAEHGVRIRPEGGKTVWVRLTAANAGGADLLDLFADDDVFGESSAAGGDAGTVRADSRRWAPVATGWSAPLAA